MKAIIRRRGRKFSKSPKSSGKTESCLNVQMCTNVQQQYALSENMHSHTNVRKLQIKDVQLCSLQQAPFSWYDKRTTPRSLTLRPSSRGLAAQWAASSLVSPSDRQSVGQSVGPLACYTRVWSVTMCSLNAAVVIACLRVYNSAQWRICNLWIICWATESDPDSKRKF